MNKKIKDLASLCLNNKDYNKLSNLLNQNELNRARLYINDLIDELELKIESSSEYDKTVLYEEFYGLKQIEDEIFNLYVEEDEGEQIKQSVGQ
jgi:hypothetical protein